MKRSFNFFSTPCVTTNMSSFLSSTVSVRDQLINAGFYLAHASSLDNVQWGANGRKSILLARPPNSSRPSEMSPAVLSAILVLSEQGFFLTSDANWKGPSEINPHLNDVKGTCIGTSPQVNLLRDDFTLLIDNARSLQSITATHEDALCVGFLRNQTLKFRHVLFEVRDVSYNLIIANFTSAY